MAGIFVEKSYICAKQNEMDTTYIKSNSVEKVCRARVNKKLYKELLCVGDGVVERRDACKKLLEYLCKVYAMPVLTVKVVQRKRVCTAGGETHGFIRCGRDITIYNLTAKRGNAVAIKTFADTLLHEFMHGYDYHVLKLAGSPHTAGFYKRITDLKSKLS